MQTARSRTFLTLLLPITLLAGAVLAQDGGPELRSAEDTFTYFGELRWLDQPYTGEADLIFTLWDQPTNGAQVAAQQLHERVIVIDGLFQAKLSFAEGTITDAPLWLEIAVRAPAGEGEFTTLAPRQSVRPRGNELRNREFEDEHSDDTGVNYGVYGIGGSTSGFDFYAAGPGTNYGASSSIRWKHNIEVIADPLYKLAQLRGVNFDWDQEHGGHHDVGMIAEEVGEVLPEIVQYEENGIDAVGMDYSKLTPLLVEALKALHEENEQLRAEKDAEIAAQQREINSLHERLARLESLVAQLATEQE